MKIINTVNLVLVVEEFGYKHWIWNPDFSVSNLKNYWLGIEKADYTNMKQVLTGEIFCIEDEPDQYFDQYWEKFHTLAKEGTYPYLHYCCDDDSYLIINNEEIFHKGYSGKKFEPLHNHEI